MRTLAIAVGLVVALVATARAESGPVVFASDLDRASCDARAVRAAVIEILGEDPFTDDGEATLRVATSGRDGAIDAVVELLDGDGVVLGARRVHAGSCTEAAAELAVVIVLVLRTDFGGAPAFEPEPEPEIEIDPVSEPVPEAPAPMLGVATRVARRRAPPLAFAMSAEGGVGHAASGWYPTLALGARMRRGPWSLGLSAGLRPREALVVGGTGRVVISTSTLSLTPCAHRTIAICGLVSAGWIRGRGEALMDARAVDAAHVGLGGRVAWERALNGSVGVTVHVDLEVAVTSTRFLVDFAPVWESPRHQQTVGVGLFALIP